MTAKGKRDGFHWMTGYKLDPTLRVRSERAGDHEAVFQVNRNAFPTPVEAELAEAELVEALRPIADPLVSLVAEAGGQVVGHVLFTPVTLEQNADDALAMGLAPVAVLPEFQGRGIGSVLIRRGLEICRELGQGAVFVLGEPGYYGRFGFEPAATHGLRYKGLDLKDYFMALELVPGVLAGCSGAVHYLPPFDDI